VLFFRLLYHTPPLNIQVKCDNCKMPVYIPSSLRIGRMYEVNYRFAFVMRMLGLSLAGCKKFCGLMDISSNFVSKAVYNYTRYS